MAQTNVIVNGTFDAGSANWSGTDIETNFPEGAYLGNGSTNAVSEIDGNAGPVTVMEQSFTLTDPHVAELKFDVALRNASLPNAGSEGFTVEILDASGGVLASATILPTTNSFVATSIPVSFTAAGTYTLRFTEVGPNDSLGAIIDNVEVLVCFAGATAIATPFGHRPARDIRPGDQVMTENGPRPVLWVGRREVTPELVAADDRFRPIRIMAGALGGGLPRRDLLVSRQHRLLVRSAVAARMFGEAEVLLPAIRLTALPGIYLDRSIDRLDYIHILLETHEILSAEGAPAESMLLGDHARMALSRDAQEELALILPDAPDPARLIPERKRQIRLVERLAANDRAVVEPRRA